MTSNLTAAIKFKCKNCNDLSFKNIVYIEDLEKYAIICKICLKDTDKEFFKENTLLFEHFEESCLVVDFDILNKNYLLSHDEIVLILGKKISPKKYNLNIHYGFGGKYFLHSNGIILDTNLYNICINRGNIDWKNKIINKFISKSTNEKYPAIFNCSELELHNTMNADVKCPYDDYNKRLEIEEHDDSYLLDDEIYPKEDVREREIEDILQDEYIRDEEMAYHDLTCNLLNTQNYNIEYFNAEVSLYNYKGDTEHSYDNVEKFLKWKNKKGY